PRSPRNVIFLSPLRWTVAWRGGSPLRDRPWVTSQRTRCATVVNDRTTRRHALRIDTVWPHDRHAPPAPGAIYAMSVGAGSAPFDPIVRGHLEKCVDSLHEEFGELYSREQIRTLVDESAEELARGRVSTFVPALSHRFARERLKALAHAEGRLTKEVPQVLFVSLRGGGRAQMGAALLSHRAGERVEVQSAGSQAGATVDENVRLAMQEIGIDLSEAFTKPLTPEVLAGADVV